jgi:hypothetical protein
MVNTVLLAKGETVLRGEIDRLNGIGTGCGMEKKVEKTTIPAADYDGSNKTEECGIFELFWLL